MSQHEINADEHIFLKFGYKPVLSRKLSLLYLIAFGLNYLQPMGPVVIFGLLLTKSSGSVILPYLLAFVGMFFTLCSYIRLSKEFPLAGSLYSYIYHIMGNKVAFIAGWLLLLDYLLIPAIALAGAAHYIQASSPKLHYGTILATVTLLMAIINIRGIYITSRVSLIILLGQLAVVITFIVMCINWAYHTPLKLIISQPFEFSGAKNLLQAASLAIFGYLGFDAISTLSEESNKPFVNIPKAMFFCLFIGCILACLVAYFGTLVMPDWRLMVNRPEWINTALFNISGIVGGNLFASLFTYAFILAMLATNIVGTTAASRLLFSMGRDGVLPSQFFSKIHKKWKTPYCNIIFLALICLTIGSLSSIEQIVGLINYGTIASFILLNISAIIFCLKNKKDNSFLVILPIVAAIIMFVIFVNMQRINLLFGTLWLILGIAIMFFLNLNLKNN